ncbi:uncharacterized protein LOC34618440 [Cyclospora cayetanensis]|uniref:Uncharacterized protein LOC34618440 n=1 Tax=Cyclospora cayetanensis TaxID=88456 RepID=A0A6P6RQM5_9EIME|nr:uncharacterized protein LOC34618440 [Cyclospora cayetanensis]
MVSLTAFFRASLPRFSGGAAKPKWSVDRQQLFGAARADKHHYGEHPTYNHFLLFIRGLRPALEEAAESTAQVIGNATRAVWLPTKTFVQKHNPDLRLQLVALSSFFATSMFITGCLNDTFQKIVDLTSLLEHRAAGELEREGFWQTAEQEREGRQQQLQQQQQRLESCWLSAIAAATSAKDFGVLCDRLELASEADSKLELAQDSAQKRHGAGVAGKPVECLPPIRWRFEMMPYGADSPDAHAFPTPSHEQPLRAFSLSFTSNNLSGNWGDYVNRQDNKGAIMRPSRVMFTDVFIPTTK